MYSTKCKPPASQRPINGKRKKVHFSEESMSGYSMMRSPDRSLNSGQSVDGRAGSPLKCKTLLGEDIGAVLGSLDREVLFDYP